MNPTNKIHIAGHRSLVGSALMRRRTNPSPQTIETTRPSPTCGLATQLLPHMWTHHPAPPPHVGEVGRGS